jgi:predicted negative regulator of RcsB-dependent stress response
MNTRTKNVLLIVSLVVLVVAGFVGYAIMENNKKNQNGTEPVFTGEATKQTVDLYYVLLDDNGKNGQKIGCNDSLVLAKEEIETSSNITDTLARLMGAPRRSSNGYYNALAGARLSIQKYALGSANPATLYLTGQIKPGGTCDVPRIEAQLMQTVKQFTDTSNGRQPDLRIFLNNKPLAKALSTK